MLIAPEHKLYISPQSILIIQLGDIGDVIWSIPTFRALKASFPEALLSVVTRKPYGDFLLDDPSISKVFQISDIWQQVKLMLHIRRERFDLLFDLRADDRGTVVTFISGAKMKCALHYPGRFWRDKAFTHLLQEAPPRERFYGAAEQSLRIVRGFGIKEITYMPQIIVVEETRKKAVELLAAHGVAPGSFWVSISPFSRWPYKEWGMDKWREVALFVWHQYRMPAIIVGSKEEQSRAEKLIAGATSPMINLTGRTNLRELAALLKMSKLHMGVDSAPPHVAAAVGTRNLTVYGPTDWRDWVLPDPQNHVVSTDMSCSPCYQKGCDGRGISRCLDNLSADKVIDALQTMEDSIVV
ncbi:MAG TPA: glycosyltransferase family 9 protein [Smithellaceae bacterium]|nr:glycosyltransferase family 9 protein [Smithellaceae bacterium]